jgi:tRNA(His) 5'-end guanylyltransferase
MKDSLGDRIKENYENRTRYSLARRTYTIIRIDGKAFHTYTKGLTKPFDEGLTEDLDLTAAYLCKNISGSKFAFVQSDEISILLTDFETEKTQAWFDNNLQKMASVSASLATAKFNELRYKRNLKITENLSYPDDYFLNWKSQKLATFDSRVFQIPQKTEVENYFIWRQQDTTRNSISSVAQSLYNQKQLHGKNSDEQQELIFQKGINWNDCPAKYKRGRMIIKEQFNTPGDGDKIKEAIRTRWISIEVPIFTQDRVFLSNKIPTN